jgi:hypothetical protein
MSQSRLTTRELRKYPRVDSKNISLSRSENKLGSCHDWAANCHLFLHLFEIPEIEQILSNFNLRWGLLTIRPSRQKSILDIARVRKFSREFSGKLLLSTTSESISLPPFEFGYEIRIVVNLRFIGIPINIRSCFNWLYWRLNYHQIWLGRLCRLSRLWRLCRLRRLGIR